jgi:hypothetical protein
VLPGGVSKLGKVAGYDWVGRSLIGNGSGKVIQSSKRSGKVGLTRSGMCPGMTRVSARVKFQVTRLAMAQVATRVRHRVTRSGMTWVSDPGMVPGSDLGKELGTISDKDPGKRSGTNLDKEAGQDKIYKTRRLLSKLKEEI